MGALANRRAQTDKRILELRRRLGHAANISQTKACVYATGSFGRGEASAHSDLDIFVVGKTLEKPNKEITSSLSHLDEILVMAELVKVTRDLEIQEFSGDGEYLKHYTVDELTKTLGLREDDVANTFTARLLLLLESSWLVEPDVYEEIIKQVIQAYWRDYEGHETNFVPAFLINDILRLWRTFCVNYESGTERFPDDKKAKGKLKNYKLKHSRLLTCYSALLYLLAVFKRNGTVSPEDALQMSKLTPTQRVEWVSQRDDCSDAREKLGGLLEQYEQFLETTDAPEADLISKFKTQEMIKKCSESGYKLGDYMFEALGLVGRADLSGEGRSRLYRLLVV